MNASSFPPDFFRGVRLFNDSEYFEAHEVLEDVWREQAEPDRQLTQGIIQVAVALYHARNRNFIGAEKLLRRGIPRIEQSLALNAGIDIENLLRNSQEALNAVANANEPPAFAIILNASQ